MKLKSRLHCPKSHSRLLALRPAEEEHVYVNAKRDGLEDGGHVRTYLIAHKTKE